MKSIGIASLLCILCLSSGLQAQVTTEDFTNKYTQIYLNISDTAKATKIAMEAFEMLENNESLQKSGNYFVLRAIFENLLKDEEMAKKCEQRANALLTFDTQVQKPETYENSTLEWSYEYQMEFYKRTDLAFGKEALKFLNSHPELHNYTNFSALANFFELVGDFQRANTLYERGYELLSKDPNEVVSLINYAMFLFKSGNYQKVEELVLKNDELLEAANQYAKFGYELSGQMIRMYYSLYTGDYVSYVEASDNYYDYFEQQNQDTDFGYNPYAFPRLSNKAWGEESSGQWEAASVSWKRADSAQQAANSALASKYPNMPLYSYSSSPLFEARFGKPYDREKAIEELDSYYKELAAATPAYGKPSFPKAQQYGFLKDERYHEQFREVLKQQAKKRDFTEATLPLSTYAYFLMRDGYIEDSFRAYRALFEENINWVNDIIFTFGEKAFVAYYTSKLKEGYDNFHSMTKLLADAGDPLHSRANEIAYDNTLLTKSIAFKGVRKRKKAFLLSNSDEIKDLYNQWILKKEKLMQMYQVVHSSKQRGADLATQESTYAVNEDSLAVLQQEVDLLENRLATEANNFKETLRVSTPSWKQVRTQLKPGEAAIEMVRFRLRNQVYYSDSVYYVAYIIKHDSRSPEAVYLPRFADYLESEAINGYKNAIRFKINDNQSYTNFWKPIGDRLDGVTKVYFSPDGIYHLISLPTLRNPETNAFLMDEVIIQNVTGTQYIGSSGKVNSKSASLFGRPNYKIDGEVESEGGTKQRSMVQNFRNDAITDLPGTEEEVDAIQKILNGSNISSESYLGNDASENKFYELDNPNILHIATHGYWSENKGKASAGYQIFNALVNSGLLLSGVVDYYQATTPAFTNDGILTAYEAQNLNLEETDLVVLSACETGLGSVNAGEGVYGLQRAFRTAGVKNSITSLWKVDDKGTRDFMITFYRKLMESNEIASSFRFAQQEMKKKYTDPYYWGAFVLVGD